MSDWWVAELWARNPMLLVSWVVWVIGSIVLHELAHGWAAIRCGDDTPIHTGHMTWNPMVHMGPASLIAFAIIGIAWGMMPVNPNNFRGRYDSAIVAVAGPLMNLALALAALAIYIVARGWGGGSWFNGVLWPEPFYSNLAMFCWLGIMLNVVLAAFNLVPVPPLDGWRILSDLVPAFGRLWMGERSLFIGIIAFAALFWYGAPYIWEFGAGVAAAITGWAVAALAPGSVPPQSIY